MIRTFVCTFLLLPLAGSALMGEGPYPFSPPLPGLCFEPDPQTLASAAR